MNKQELDVKLLELNPILYELVKVIEHSQINFDFNDGYCQEFTNNNIKIFFLSHFDGSQISCYYAINNTKNNKVYKLNY